ncbi:MAG: hypothetical protein KAW92_10835 [Candidatus Cloacimonetes bacterium]|nr:hypothetical protein [Candidatus Cloacimonadota bacterium]
MLKKLCILEKLIPIVILLILTSCATTQKQPIVKIENIEKPEIINNLDNSLSDLTTQITNSITEDGKTKIAVIEFSDLEGNVTQFGKYLAEELITRLFRTKKFEVVERQLLNKIISEQKLSITGMIDENSAKELGRILGVDAIVSGTITDLGTSLKVNARIISTETGKVFGVAGTKIVKDETVEKLMGIISTVQKEEVQKEEVREQTEKKEISKESLKKVEVENFTFELINCKQTGQNIICDLLITNNLDEDRVLSLYGGIQATRIFDEDGNELAAQYIKLGNRGPSGRVSNTLVNGVPILTTLNFGYSSTKVKLLSLLEIHCNDNVSGRFKVRFRNISITR